MALQGTAKEARAKRKEQLRLWEVCTLLSEFPFGVANIFDKSFR